MSPDGGGEGGGSLMNLILPFGFVIAIMYFLVIRPQSKKQKEHQEFLNKLKSGDKVVTQGGLMGRVTGVRDDYITVEISDRVRVKLLRSAIATIQGEADSSDSTKK
jgi:preprotein translocase subunit YajC